MSDATYEGTPAVFRSDPIKVSILTICTGGIYYLVKWWIARHSELSVTPKGVDHETGVLRRDTARVPAARLSTYKIRQSFFQRIFGLCSLEVFGSGDKPEIVVDGLDKVDSLKAALSRFDQ